MPSLSSAHPPTQSDPASFRLQRKHNYEYPPFTNILNRHESLDSAPLPRLRGNLLVIKLYTPGGFTESGIFVEPKKGPPIWGHVMALPPDIGNYSHVDIGIGDMVLFHRYADDVILRQGEQTLSIIHIKSVQALFSPPLVRLSCTSLT
jgi:co-chaperonin GroES (HSP10)